MAYQLQKNLSATRYDRWQVRSLAGLATHVTVGGIAQLFEFRPVGERTAFQFLFLGGGLGVGASVGVGSTGFPMPHQFLADTAQLVGFAFVEAGRGMLGMKPRPIPEVGWQEDITGFANLESGPFSALDLHLSGGRLTAGSASIAMGYSTGFITAFSTTVTWFDSQPIAGHDKFLGISGQAGGVGAGVHANVGIWLHVQQ
ncbi:MAG: hypothetical protein AAF515_15970 [Pseudomonadota bacterium]